MSHEGPLDLIVYLVQAKCARIMKNVKCSRNWGDHGAMRKNIFHAFLILCVCMAKWGLREFDLENNVQSPRSHRQVEQIHLTVSTFTLVYNPCKVNCRFLKTWAGSCSKYPASSYFIPKVGKYCHYECYLKFGTSCPSTLIKLL